MQIVVISLRIIVSSQVPILVNFNFLFLVSAEFVDLHPENFDRNMTVGLPLPLGSLESEIAQGERVDSIPEFHIYPVQHE